MKKLILCVLSVLLTFNAPTVAENRVYEEPKKVIVYADFRSAYNRLRKYEGFYANHKDDLGKVTYAGITKKYNSNWYGWNYIDRYNLKPNEQVTGQDSLIVEFYVLDYYLDIWISEGFDKLKNQAIANYLFDMRVHMSRRQTIKLLNKLYPTADLKMRKEWVDPILDKIDLQWLKNARLKYYDHLMKKNPKQNFWKKGWTKRANDLT